MNEFLCSGYAKVVEILINNDAKKNTLNRNGFSALDYAYNATEGKLFF